jgi:N-acetylmuramoyl-L-alanine amidase
MLISVIRKETAILVACCLFLCVVMVTPKPERFKNTSSYLPLMFHTIAIDPGHGGPDPGAVGRGEVYEADIDLAVAKRLSQLLQGAGAHVVMTRWNEQDLGRSSNYMERMKEDFRARRDMVAASGAQYLISIHANSFPGAFCEGPQTFYDDKAEESKQMASSIQEALNKLIPRSERVPLPLDHYIIETARIPAVTVEVGFMTNQKELQQMMTAAYQEQLAFAIYAGLLEHMTRQPKH